MVWAVRIALMPISVVSIPHPSITRIRDFLIAVKEDPEDHSSGKPGAVRSDNSQLKLETTLQSRSVVDINTRRPKNDRI